VHQIAVGDVGDVHLEFAPGDSAIPEKLTFDEEDRRVRDSVTHQEIHASLGRESDCCHRKRRGFADFVENSKGVIAVVTTW
jgi:hypothetical protein